MKPTKVNLEKRGRKQQQIVNLSDSVMVSSADQTKTRSSDTRSKIMTENDHEMDESIPSGSSEKIEAPKFIGCGGLLAEWRKEIGGIYGLASPLRPRDSLMHYQPHLQEENQENHSKKNDSFLSTFLSETIEKPSQINLFQTNNKKQKESVLNDMTKSNCFSIDASAGQSNSTSKPILPTLEGESGISSYFQSRRSSRPFGYTFTEQSVHDDDEDNFHPLKDEATDDDDDDEEEEEEKDDDVEEEVEILIDGNVDLSTSRYPEHFSVSSTKSPLKKTIAEKNHKNPTLDSKEDFSSKTRSSSVTPFSR